MQTQRFMRLCSGRTSSPSLPDWRSTSPSASPAARHEAFPVRELLSLFFGALFLGAVFAQSFAGLATFNEEAQQHGAHTISWDTYLLSASFGAALLENWRSEFRAVGTMAVFTIYLRQRGSPESKPADSPHEQTAASG